MYTPKPRSAARYAQADAFAGAGGVSLIELIIFILIITVAAAAILQVTARSDIQSADPLLRKQALAIAEGILEEITLSKFTFCVPEDANADTATSPAGCASLQENIGLQGSNITRPYNNVNDYADNVGVAKTYSLDAAGNRLPEGYVVNVTITPEPALGPTASPISPADATPANMNVLRVRVAVTTPGGRETVTLDGFRTRYAPNSLP